MDNQFDIIILGAGIAGASVAAHLAQTKRVAILEMEDRPGYHTTGRSAASYEPNYGPKPMLALTRASAPFFKAPPEGFADGPLLVHRPSLFLEAEGQEAFTEKLLSASAGLEEISIAKTRDYFPVLRPDYAKRSFLDNHTGDLDVDLLHRGYLRLFKVAGGMLMNHAGATAIEREAKGWRITTPQGKFACTTLVNAAGAWGDVVAKMAGVAAVGLTPKRRSIGVIPIDYAGFEVWPMVTDNAETWYAKPQSGKMIVSSADATPVEPHDAYADDMAIAEGIERLMNATTLEVTHLDHNWGGLRSFVSDGNPVVGYDPADHGFFWLIGQGGYGIQSAPALSRTAATLILDEDIPADVAEAGLNLADITPARLRSL
ncbi:MAG: FAD-binding oxidoreductase [Alphaproteobacteria bacterium]|nr:FAD-binding oxidoreductase [Alphaproteobacteria bacterium]